MSEEDMEPDFSQYMDELDAPRIEAALRAELAQAVAREAALVERLGRVKGYARRGIESDIAAKRDASDFIRIEESVKAALADISPAAKALLERAERGEKYRRALKQIMSIGGVGPEPNMEWLPSEEMRRIARDYLAEEEKE